MSDRPVVELLPKQVEFLMDSDTRYLLYVGGYRSGKSFVLAHKVIRLAMQNPGYDGALLSPTFPMLKSVMVPLLQAALQVVGLPFTYYASQPHRFILHFPDGVDTTIYLLSAENYMRAAGLTLAFACLDEFDLIKKELAEASWKMMVSRITNGDVKQIAVSTTPEGYNFCQEFWEEDIYHENGDAKTDRRLIRVSTEDNPFIDPEYVSRMRDQYPAQQLQAYLDGHFVNLLTGSVYYCYDRDANNTNLTLADFPNHVLNIGVDFNVGHTSGSVMIIDKNLPYVLDEIVDAANTADLIKTIKQRYPTRQINVYPDSSGKSGHTNASITEIQLLRDAGFTPYFHSKNPLVRNRVGAVNAMLLNADGVRKLKVNRHKCPFTSKALTQQGYKDGAPDKSTGLDHMMDALGYAIWYHWPINQTGSIRNID